jgi:hypothetical protein
VFTPEVVTVGPFSSQTAAQRDAENARLLEAARQEFPGWDFREVFGGWLAVREGTPVVMSLDLDGIAEKLRQRGQG